VYERERERERPESENGMKILSNSFIYNQVMRNSVSRRLAVVETFEKEQKWEAKKKRKYWSCVYLFIGLTDKGRTRLFAKISFRN
jgi:hypothetical protein